MIMAINFNRTTLILLFIFCNDGALGCQNGWIGHGRSCYHFSHDREDWANAVTICKILGGYLLEINDAAEYQYIVAQAKLADKSYWSGLNDLQEEGTWIWVTSQTPITDGSFKAWQSGQPDNARDNENCADLQKDYNYLWNDAPCSILLNYICEQAQGETEIIG